MNLYDIFEYWDREVHPVTLGALGALTEAQLHWKPAGWHSSAQDLAFHTCNVEWVWIYRNVLRLEPWEARWHSKGFAGLPELLAYWRDIHATTVQWLKETPATELQRQCPLPYEYLPEASLQWIVNHVMEHEIHHRGQLFMLMRMQGVEPPKI